MAFSKDFGSVLSPFINQYKEANDKGRKAVLKSAADAVLKANEQLEDTTLNLTKDLPNIFLFLLALSLSPNAYQFRP
jgi:hypothetical protein